MKRFFFVLFLGFFVNTATAASPEVSIISPIKIDEIRQNAQESWDDFLDRTAITMSNFTDKTGFEAGGWLCFGPSGGAINVVTIESQISISAFRACPRGDFFPGYFMHSHPSQKNILLTKKDLDGYPMGAFSRFFFGFKEGKTIRIKSGRRHFSAPDRALGPGYLVYKNELYFQEGGPQSFVRFLPKEY